MRMHSGVTPGGMPTLVVAASNSLHPERADYICDGTGDEVQIQAAITALPAGGGKVILTEGDFYIAHAISLPSNVTMAGVGDTTIVHLAAGRHSTMSTANLVADNHIHVVDGTQFAAGDWLCIRNIAGGANSIESRIVLSVVGNTVTLTANLTWAHGIGTEVWTAHPMVYTPVASSGQRIMDIYFDGNRLNQMVGVLGALFVNTGTGNDANPALCMHEVAGSILLTDCSNVRIERCKIGNMPSMGIFLYGLAQNVSDVLIEHCNIFCVYDKGIVSLQIDATQTINIRVLNNYLDNCGDGVNMSDGIGGVNYGDAIQFHAPTGHDVKIIGNTIGWTRRSAILVDGVITGVISDNTADNTTDVLVGYGGIMIWRSEAVEVSNNTMKYFNSHKVYALIINSCDNIHVNGGTFKITGTGEPGAIPFSIQGGLGSDSDNIAVDNIHAEGAKIANCNTAYIENCHNVRFNQCVFKNAQTAQTGVYIRIASHITFTDCKIFDDTGPAMDYSVETVGACHDIRFAGCDITSGSAGTLLDANGNVGPRLAQPFLCVLAYGTNNILAASGNGTYSPTTQIDLCRNLVAKVTKGTGTGNGQIVVTGVDQFGNATTEAYTFTGGATATQVMVKLFSTVNVNGIVISGLTGTDTIELGVGNKIGLVSKIFTGAVVKCSNGTGFITAAGYAEDITYHGVDFTVHGAIAAGDVYTIFYMNCLA